MRKAKNSQILTSFKRLLPKSTAKKFDKHNLCANWSKDQAPLAYVELSVGGRSANVLLRVAGSTSAKDAHEDEDQAGSHQTHFSILLLFCWKSTVERLSRTLVRVVRATLSLT